MAPTQHIPVLLKETIELLNLRPGDQAIDGTVGLGGHAKAILEKISPSGLLLALDRDPRQIEASRANLAKDVAHITFINDSYANLAQHAYAQGFVSPAAVLLDLGYSSVHVDNPERGFSFQTEGPLDMRYDPAGELTADTIVNTWSEEELARIFLVYGEDRNAKKIARAIREARREKKFTTTTELAELIATVVPRHGKVHPATKVFQALRITVNDELGELERALPKIIEIMKPGGRLAIISFHSLEDRIVKTFFKRNDKKTLNIINKHVIVPSEEEMESNPRSRSAKLRVAEKI
ncbi:MAG: 16S rRNA (cytosine(1402)-N(4))-methyltransferase RsmH [Patescibacteria group bacterium]|jgi:16S rRNA (cytosine1402-N4)-methyltransferase